VKFLELHLQAYGPFRDRRLSFARRPLAVHVLFGRNEAGKSTALRALRGLLYGIERTTRDAHLHRAPDLRIGARLEGPDGGVLEVVRRKGNVRTLLDPAGNPLDETVLQRLLGGVGEDLFATMFGLDHETLRQGAEALLRGGGNVGESLFQAGIGGAGLHDVLASIEAEADGLFAPQAKTRPLAVALAQFKDAKKRSVEDALGAESWEAQDRAILDARAARADHQRQLEALQEEHKRLRRARAALPLLAALAELRQRRGALAGVVLLPVDAAREHHDAVRESTEATAALERVGQRIRDLQARRTALEVPDALLEEEAAVEDLQQRSGGARKAAADLPRVRDEADRLEAEVAELRTRLGSGGIPDASTEERIRALAMEAGTRAERVANVAADLEEHDLVLAGLRADLAALPPFASGSSLAAACARLRSGGDLEAALDRIVRDKAAALEAARARLATLGLRALPPERVHEVPFMPHETLALHRESRQSLDQDLSRIERESADVERGLEQARTQIETLRGQGDLPAEQDLAAARAARDESWKTVLRLWSEGTTPDTVDKALDPHRPAAAAHADRQTRADALADRLRREAERIARMAQLVAERDSLLRRQAALATERQAAKDREASSARAWSEAWQDCGVKPRSPAEMVGWRVKLDEALAFAETARVLAREEESSVAQIARARSELDLALQSAGQPASTGKETVATLLERAEATASSLEEAGRRRETLEQALRDHEARRRSLARRKQEAEGADSDWRQRWGASLAAASMPEGTAPKEALALLDVASRLAHKQEERTRQAARVSGIERDLSEFRAAVDALVTRHAPELARLGEHDRALELVKRFQKGLADRQERQSLDRQLALEETARERETERKANAESRLAVLLRSARVADLDALRIAEERSEEARALDQRIAEHEARLVEAGGGLPASALEKECAGLDVDQVSVRLDACDQERKEIADQLFDLGQEIGNKEAGQPILRDGMKAVAAAAEAQEHLARARSVAERYVRLRLAAAVLARQIEVYRERNQGPLLQRASELFSRLTLGSFGALRAAFDEHDEPVLQCVRSGGGGDVEVAGLSEGTRDQLYLALRLASLERYAEANDPMPFVVDDVLVHFDDDRAAAALELLGELAKRTQVLFFTHHARLAEIARRVVPEERLLEHELG
jgi:uncharacterized protein YhaN